MNYKIALVAAVAAIASSSQSLPLQAPAHNFVDRTLAFLHARTYNQDAMDAFSRLAAPPSSEYPIAPNAQAPNAP
ncbi:hypothetical protein E3P99_01385 [Wallemia hederae]|uniref:Uncharacterized protein n=1 Tax=Wallemia hederae TaxID=1540922 RepID=A0A4T0FQR5_9BASI|nr:hypothetical protein E3P99_01385 [Wallemia hederae]